MKRFVWILVASHVVLAAGLFVSLALEAVDLFVLLTASLLGLAVIQRFFLSRRGDRAGGTDADSRPVSRPRPRS